MVESKIERHKTIEKKKNSTTVDGRGTVINTEVRKLKWRKAINKGTHTGVVTLVTGCKVNW